MVDALLNNFLMVGLSRVATVIGVPLLLWGASQFWAKIDGYEGKIAALRAEHVNDLKGANQEIRKLSETVLTLQIKQNVAVQQLGALQTYIFNVNMTGGLRNREIESNGYALSPSRPPGTITRRTAPRPNTEIPQ